MRKIIYLIEQPLDERNYDRFGIQSWIDRGWDVEVWDLTPHSHPRVWHNYIESGHKLKEFTGYFPVASKSQLEQRYSRLERIKYFIDLTGDKYFSVQVKKRLVRMGGVRTIFVNATPKPDDVHARGVISKFKRVFSSGPVKSLKRFVDAVACKMAARSIKPGVIIVSGENSLPDNLAGSRCKVLKAHSFDYDTYLKRAKLLGGSEGKYAVFIDQNYCFHSDFIYQDVPSFVTPERYYPAICNGLRRISKELNVDLRVAAHPRSSYQRSGRNYFEGIPVEHGKTVELIGGCAVVVCHDSTAIQFAVLFNKPVIFVTTDELIPAYEGKCIEKFASELGKSVVNLDRDLSGVNWKHEMRVDSKKYVEYRNKYIKIDGSPEMPYWDIVASYMEKMVSPVEISNPSDHSWSSL